MDKNGCSFRTYALTVTSNRIAAIGIRNRPSQKTGDENNSLSMPENTAAIGIDGQKLLENKTNDEIKAMNYRYSYLCYIVTY